MVKSTENESLCTGKNIRKPYVDGNWLKLSLLISGELFLPTAKCGPESIRDYLNTGLPP